MTDASLALEAPLASPTFTGTVSGITKAMVGLSNVDDTFDVSKPISTATASALELKAPLASPTSTGTVTMDPALPTKNDNTVASTAFVKTVVGELVNGAPATLDTLKKLADTLGSDANFFNNSDQQLEQQIH